MYAVAITEAFMGSTNSICPAELKAKIINSRELIKVCAPGLEFRLDGIGIFHYGLPSFPSINIEEVR
jgi:hypothetical protein